MKTSQPNLKSQKKVLTRQRVLIKQKRIAEKKELDSWHKAHADVIVYYYALLKDFTSLLSTYSVTDQLRDTATLTKRFKAEGVSFVTVSLPQLAGGLLSFLETGVSVYPGFKIKPGREYPVFLQGLFAPIYSDVHSQDAVTAVGLIYQLSVLCKKLKGPYPHRVLLKQAEDFVEDDRSLSKIDLNSEHLQPILQHATAIIDEIFKDFDLDRDVHAMPRPGPGATNTKVEKHMRYEPHVLYEKIDHVMPYKQWFYPGITGYHVNKARNYRSLLKGRKYEPRARFHQVDKKVGESRGICVEENEAMWFQQAVKSALYYHIEHHYMTKGLVNFTEQGINQLWALLCSEDRSSATIDMKSASDRVPRELVRRLFANQNRLCEVLMALSTSYIDFPTLGLKPLKTLKYAPMGSALCFPIMAIVHFVLCKAIILASNTPKRFAASKEILVYGDDIIIKSSCTQAIFDWLPQFGMKLNRSKSFVNGYFRESCGLHAYKGVEITPVFMKRTPYLDSGAATLLAVLAQEEQLHSRGYTFTASELRKRVNAYWGILPFVSNESNIAGFRRNMVNDPTHIKLYASKSRKHVKRTLHCSEHRMRVFKPSRELAEACPYMCENSRYLMKLVTGTHEARTPDLSPDDVKLVWTWLLDSQLTTGCSDAVNM